MNRAAPLILTAQVLLSIVAVAVSRPSLAQNSNSAAAVVADPVMINARQKFFGKENVDARTGDLSKDKVIFSWLTNSTFAVSIAGRVMYFDTFVTRLEVTPGRAPFVIKDMVDLKPEAILLGHGHFDHADNAAYIAAKTGATIYASQETCGAMRQDFARMKDDPIIQENPVAKFAANASVKCTDVTTAGSKPAADIVQLSVLEPVACVLAFRHLHSVAVPPDPTYPPTPVRIIEDPRDKELFPRGVPLTPSDKRRFPRATAGEPLQPGQMDLQTTEGPGGPVSIFYQVVMRSGANFTLAWQDTAGALKEGKGMAWDGTPEDGQRIVEVLRSLPLTDVLMGTAASGNFANNGLRDIIMYQRLLEPKIYVPNHLTTGSVIVEATSLSVYAGFLRQLELMNIPKAEWPEIRWLVDPTDYMRPIVFDLGSSLWNNPEKAARVSKFCDK
jgi:hypothetical protein